MRLSGGTTDYSGRCDAHELLYGSYRGRRVLILAPRFWSRFHQYQMEKKRFFRNLHAQQTMNDDYVYECLLKEFIALNVRYHPILVAENVAFHSMMESGVNPIY